MSGPSAVEADDLDEQPVADPGVTWQGTARQYLVLFLGAAMVGTGVALTIAAELGVGSWQVFETGLMELTGANFAVVATIESIVVLAIAWRLLHQPPGPATIFFIVIVGPAVGGLLALLPSEIPTGMAVAQLLIGMVVLGIGVGFYVGAGLGASAQDSLFVGLFTRFGWRPRDARLVTDVSLVVAGFVLGGNAGIGTIVLTLGLPLVVEPGMRLGQRLARTPASAPRPDPAT